MLVNNSINDRVTSNQKIHSVGILTEDVLFNERELQDLVIEKFALRNPKVYSFRKYSKDNESSYKHFSENDFNWKGAIVDTSLKSFLEESFDLLLCFYSKKNPYLEYVTLLSAAHFKVGFAEVNEHLFDLEISVKPDQIDDFFGEAKKYLSILAKL